MQTKYVDLRRVAIELTQLGESASAPVRPSEYCYTTRLSSSGTRVQAGAGSLGFVVHAP